MTASKNTTRRTATAEATDATIKAKTANAERIERLEQELHMDTESFWERMGFRPYSLQTTLTKFIARITLYAVGVVASVSVMSLLTAAMIAGGWPMFIVSVFEIVALVCALIASWVASDAIINYIADGHVSRDIKRVGSWIGAKLVGGTGYVKTRMSMH